MKNTLLYTLALGTALTALAGTAGAAEVQQLVLSQTDGSTTAINLSDAPVLSFRGDSIVVTADGDELVFDLNGIADYHFQTVEVTTAISSITAPASGAIASAPSIAFGQASWSGLHAGDRISVVTLDGRVVLTATAGSDGTASVALSSLPRGIYILRAPHKSIKILNQ